MRLYLIFVLVISVFGCDEIQEDETLQAYKRNYKSSVNSLINKLYSTSLLEFELTINDRLRIDFNGDNVYICESGDLSIGVKYLKITQSQRDRLIQLFENIKPRVRLHSEKLQYQRNIKRLDDVLK
jgi:hypothetical protein